LRVLPWAYCGRCERPVHAACDGTPASVLALVGTAVEHARAAGFACGPCRAAQAAAAAAAAAAPAPAKAAPGSDDDDDGDDDDCDTLRLDTPLPVVHHGEVAAATAPASAPAAAPAAPARPPILERAPPGELACGFCDAGAGAPPTLGALLYLAQAVWVHANCARWSTGVVVIPRRGTHRAYGVHDAVRRARTARCSLCKLLGASLKCAHADGCEYTVHVACAVLAAAFDGAVPVAPCPDHCAAVLAGAASGPSAALPYTDLQLAAEDVAARQCVPGVPKCWQVPTRPQVRVGAVHVRHYGCGPLQPVTDDGYVKAGPAGWRETATDGSAGRRGALVGGAS